MREREREREGEREALTTMNEYRTGGGDEK
jgi:hypothetical protein